MAAETTGEVFRKFDRPPAFYDLWQSREGIPIHRTFHVDDLAQVELGPWERFGCRAAFVNLADAHLTTAIVLEVAPGASTKPVRHMFETWVHGVRGRGRTTVSNPGYPPVSVDWGARALFAPPLNTTYGATCSACSSRPRRRRVPGASRPSVAPRLRRPRRRSETVMRPARTTSSASTGSSGRSRRSSIWC